MLRIAIAALLLGATANLSFGQRLFTRDAKVRFSSEAPMEKIEAINKSGTLVLDQASGRIECKVLIKNFLFEKALMQEHFNENYMESTKFPNAAFKGTIANLDEVKFDKDGKYPVRVKGVMEMHGVKKDIEAAGVIKVDKGAVTVKSDFDLKCSDYDIKIEANKLANISNEIKVSVEAALEPMKQ